MSNKNLFHYEHRTSSLTNSHFWPIHLAMVCKCASFALLRYYFAVPNTYCVISYVPTANSHLTETLLSMWPATGIANCSTYTMKKTDTKYWPTCGQTLLHLCLLSNWWLIRSDLCKFSFQKRKKQMILLEFFPK